MPIFTILKVVKGILCKAYVPLGPKALSCFGRPPLPPAFAAEGPKYRNHLSDFWPIIMNRVNKNEAKIVKNANRLMPYKLFFLMRHPLVILVSWWCPHLGFSAMNRKRHIVSLLESLILISLKNGLVKDEAGADICHQSCSQRPDSKNIQYRALSSRELTKYYVLK